MPQDIVIRNLDYILTVSTNAVATASLDTLAALEKSLDLKSSEAWSNRRLPTPTATFHVIMNSEEEDSENEFLRTRDNLNNISTSVMDRFQRLDESFLHPYGDVNQGICRQIRALRKKLQQIEMLEEKQAKGHLLDDQQTAKLKTRSALESSLAELGVPVETLSPKASSSVSLDGKVGKKVVASKKQRRKSKHKAADEESVSGNRGVNVEPNLVKGFAPPDVSPMKHKVDF